MPGTLESHNASLKGDPRWASASPWTRRGELVVSLIFVLSIIETVLGGMWITSFQLNTTVPKTIQILLILPGLAFFIAVPSLRLRCLKCRNPPILAAWFSITFVVLLLASSLTFLVSCNLPASATLVGFRRIECSTAVEGVHHGLFKGMWWTVVIFEIILMILYGVHGAMAYYVKKVEERKEQQRKVLGLIRG